ncbi:MAG: hypothetical protein FJ317_07135, partial [SAR202 cluster bacterium]|nr:hypothetical protein [SAR202 cluster bacterium]
MPTPPALRTIGSRAVRVGALVLLFIVLNLPSWATPHAAEAATVTELAKLVASDGAAGDGFGYSIAIDGDSAVMGAHGDGGAQGAAYVFIRDGDTWSQQAKLTASDGAAGDFFGISVAISGDSVLVGAYGDGGARGAAYVFTRSGTTWSQQAKLTASDGEANHHFGNSVAVSGDTAVVGAHAASFTGLSQTGTAYVYVRSGGTWSGQQKLNPSNSEGVHEFGISVAISGDTAVVGAHHDQVKDPGQEEGGILGQGAAHVFVRSGDTWSQQAKLVASDGEVNDNLGISVAISGDTVVAGAYTDDVGGNVNQGAGYVFMRSGTTWSEQSKLTASDGAASDFFGNS